MVDQGADEGVPGRPGTIIPSRGRRREILHHHVRKKVLSKVSKGKREKEESRPSSAGVSGSRY